MFPLITSVFLREIKRLVPESEEGREGVRSLRRREK